MVERNLGYTASATNPGPTTTTSPDRNAAAATAGPTPSTEGLQAEAEGVAQAPDTDGGRDGVAMDEVDGDEGTQRATADRQETAPPATVFRCPGRKHLSEPSQMIGRRLTRNC